MAKIEYNGITFDSTEELEFYHWLKEAADNNLIYKFAKCGKKDDTFELVEKQHYYVNGKKKHCFASVEYTPDFIVYTDEFVQCLEKDMSEDMHYLDVKGSFSKYNDNKQFQIIRKMMYKIHGIYVHKVVPEKLFKKTWCPELVRYTPKTGKLRKKYIKCKTIKEFLNG